MIMSGMIGLALVVCCALIAQADFKGKEVVMYGLGSGEEEEAAHGVFTSFETFADNADLFKAGEKHAVEDWGKYEGKATEYYKEVFEKAEESEEQKDAEKEVDFAIKEAIAEHKILEAFAKGEDPSAKR